MGSRDSFSKRLKRLTEPKSGLMFPPLATLARPDLPPPPPSPPPDLSNPYVWTALARGSFDPKRMLQDPHLQKAFEAFKLNPEDPIDCRLLMGCLARVAFPESNRRGAPKKWKMEQYCLLLSAVHELKSKKPGRSDREACAIIAKKKNNPLFQKAGVEGLRKALREARSYKKNDLVKDQLDKLKPKIMQELKAAGNWSAEMEGLFYERCERLVADKIGALWRQPLGETTS
jgi:hypothetical protein